MMARYTMSKAAAKRIAEELFNRGVERNYKLDLQDWSSVLRKLEFQGHLTNRCREVLEVLRSDEKLEKLANTLCVMSFEALMNECLEHREAMGHLSSALRHMNEIKETFEEV